MGSRVCEIHLEQDIYRDVFAFLEAAYLISYEELIVNGECNWVVWAKPPQWSVDGGSIFLPFLRVFQYQRNYEVMVLGYVESGDV